MPVNRMRGAGGPASAGRRDWQVTIQQRPEADSSHPSGFPVDGAWTTLGCVFMTRDAVSGEEQDRPGQRFAVAATRWEMPYRCDMDPDALDVPKLRRLLYRGRVYDIESAANIGRRQAIELVTRASTEAPTA